jgi:hypothetical protein
VPLTLAVDVAALWIRGSVAGSILADRICHGARLTHYLIIDSLAPSPARSARDGRPHAIIDRSI